MSFCVGNDFDMVNTITNDTLIKLLTYGNTYLPCYLSQFKGYDSYFIMQEIGNIIN